jgi:hypothetical protein
MPPQLEFTSPLKMFGVYVSSFSVNIGWGGQGGTMQVKLIEDEDNNIVLEKDSNGNPFFGGSDLSPQTGSACYLKYGNFYFGGIFQRWTYNVDATSGRTYDLVFEAPSKLMDGVQIILEDYNGATDIFANQYNNYDFSTNILSFHCGYNNVHNIFNVFGAWENPAYGANGLYLNFGASGFNSSGIPLDKLLQGMAVLMQEDSSNFFGGPITFGATDEGQAGTNYSFDLTELAEFFDQESIDFRQYRLKGPTKNVNGILSEIGELFQFDYYYSIEHRNVQTNTLVDGGGRIPSATIKVKIVSKRKAPEKNRLRGFIQEELQKPDDERTIMNYTLGKEFGDTVTQKLVYGARRTRYLKVGMNNAWAVWGKGNEIIDSATGYPKKTYNTVGYVPQVYAQPLGAKPILIEGYGWYLVSPFELRMALGGKEVWQCFKTFQTIAEKEPNGYNVLINAPWAAGFDFTSTLLSVLAGGQAANSYDLVVSNLQNAAKQWLPNAQELADKIFSGVNNIATQSFGQEFLLTLPNEIPGAGYNVYSPAEEYQVLKSWEISDSAFDSRPLTVDISAWDAVGRVTSLACFPFRNDCDYSGLGSDYNVGTNQAAGCIVTKKGSPEKESFFDSTGLFGGGFMCLFKTGCQIKLFDAITTPDFGLTVLASMFFNLNIPPERYIGSGKQSVQFAIPPDVLLPTICGVPQESGRLNYGPWITLSPSVGGYFNPNGKAEVLSDESLRPETYGSYGNLRIIGNITAAVAETNLIEAESGSVDIAGAPSWNIGERFASTGPYVSNMSISVDATGGVKTSYKFNTWTPQFGTIAKYNIDRLQKVNQNRFNFFKKSRDNVEIRPFPKIRFEKTDFSELTKAQGAHQNGTALQMLFGAKNTQGNLS